MTRKWNIFNCQLNGNYDVGNEIFYNRNIEIQFLFCDYIDAYILVRGNLTIITHTVTWVAFKNCAPFIKCMTKINRTIIVNSENLHLFMPIYNLIE